MPDQSEYTIENALLARDDGVLVDGMVVFRAGDKELAFVYKKSMTIDIFLENCTGLFHVVTGE